MSFESTVLALSPIVFLRLDMAAPAVNGGVIPDISGNGIDGEQVLISSDGFEPYGKPSAVLSDGASKAVHFGTNTSHWLGCYGKILNRSELQITGDMTMIVFMKYIGQFGGGTFGMVGKGGSYYIGHTFSGGGPKWTAAIIDNVGNTYNVSALDLPIDDTRWYMLTLIRSGIDVFLFVNRIVWNHSVVASGLPNAVTTDELDIHRAGLAYFENYYDEFILFDYALNPDEVAAIYDSSQISSNVLLTVQKRHIWTMNNLATQTPRNFYYRHNWNTPIREEFQFDTVLMPSRNGNEQAYTTVSKYRRSLSYDLVFSNEQERSRFNARLWATNRTGVYSHTPIWSYKAFSNDDLPSGETNIPVNVQYMDFEEGDTILIGKFGDGFIVFETEEAIIDTINVGSIDLVSPTTIDHTAPFFITALRKGEVEKNLQIVSLTGKSSSTKIRVNLIVDEVREVENREIPFSVVSMYRSAELFNPFSYQMQDEDGGRNVEYKLSDENLDAGFGEFLTAYPSQAKPVTSIRYVVIGYQNIARFLGWVKHKAGTKATFWMPTLKHDFQYLASLGSNRYKFKHVEYTENYAVHEGRRDVALIKSDQTIVGKRINAAIDNGDDTETLTLDSSFSGGDITNHLQFCFLLYGRLDHDKITWDWIPANGQAAIICDLNFRALLFSNS